MEVAILATWIVMGLLLYGLAVCAEEIERLCNRIATLEGKDNTDAD